jgi:acetyl-CoA acetyltransferase
MAFVHQWGNYGGALSSVRPDDMAALVIKELMTRNASFVSRKN